LLLRVMAERNFTLGVAYSKSELIQVAIFGFLFLGDRVNTVVVIAITLGTAGVLMLAPADRERPLRALITGWTSRPALLGLASGSGFALSAVGFRGAALSLHGTPFLMAAAITLLVAQCLQTLFYALRTKGEGGLWNSLSRPLAGQTPKRAAVLQSDRPWSTSLTSDPPAH